jgi:hypothetical protein
MYEDYDIFITHIKNKFSVKEGDSIKITYNIPTTTFTENINRAHDYWVYSAIHKRPDIIVYINSIKTQGGGSKRNITSIRKKSPTKRKGTKKSPTKHNGAKK